MGTSSPPHDTLVKFGYPESVVREYRHWAVLVRPKQATLGALVLICAEAATAFSEISDEAFEELGSVIRDIEAGLRRFRQYDKINYLMLMMVDREVHYHVLPRYAKDQTYGGEVYLDPGWPAAPDLSAGPEMEGDALARIVQELRAVWP